MHLILRSYSFKGITLCKLCQQRDFRMVISNDWLLFPKELTVWLEWRNEQMLRRGHEKLSEGKSFTKQVFSVRSTSIVLELHRFSSSSFVPKISKIYEIRLQWFSWSVIFSPLPRIKYRTKELVNSILHWSQCTNYHPLAYSLLIFFFLLCISCYRKELCYLGINPTLHVKDLSMDW